jgi:hypothetical protein
MTENNENNDKIPSENEEVNELDYEAQIIENLPPEIKKIVEMGFSMQKVSSQSSNPLLSKINEKHIDRILDIVHKEEDNSYKDAQSTKRFSLIYFTIIVLFIGFLIFYLVDKDTTLLITIIEKGLYVIGGFGGGYGVKAYLDNRKRG